MVPRGRASTIARAIRLAKRSSPRVLRISDYFFNRCRIQPVRGRFTRRRIHAHIERTFLLKAEATGGVIELRRRDPEIEKNAVRLSYPDRRQQFGESGKRSVAHYDTIVSNRQRPGHRYRFRVTVNDDEASVRSQMLKERAGMATAPKGRIHERCALSLNRQKAIDRLRAQNREMLSTQTERPVNSSPSSSNPDSSASQLCIRSRQ